VKCEHDVFRIFYRKVVDKFRKSSQFPTKCRKIRRCYQGIVEKYYKRLSIQTERVNLRNNFRDKHSLLTMMGTHYLNMEEIMNAFQKYYPPINVQHDIATTDIHRMVDGNLLLLVTGTTQNEAVQSQRRRFCQIFVVLEDVLGEFVALRTNLRMSSVEP